MRYTPGMHVEAPWTAADWMPRPTTIAAPILADLADRHAQLVNGVAHAERDLARVTRDVMPADIAARLLFTETQAPHCAPLQDARADLAGAQEALCRFVIDDFIDALPRLRSEAEALYLTVPRNDPTRRPDAEVVMHWIEQVQARARRNLQADAERVLLAIGRPSTHDRRAAA